MVQDHGPLFQGFLRPTKSRNLQKSGGTVRRIFWGVVLLLGMSSVARAESIIEVDEVRNKAKNRLYPGGIDEEDLQVQIRLNPPTKKLYASTLQAEVLKIKPPVDDLPEQE